MNPRDHNRRRDAQRDERQRDYSRAGGRGPHHRGYDENETRHSGPRRYDAYEERRDAERQDEARRSYSSGGEYLRDAPAHREGWPDVNHEYEHGGDYADDVVGGNYLRSADSRSQPDFYQRREEERAARSIGPRERPRGAAGDYDRLLTGWGERGGYREVAGRGDSRSSLYGSDAPARGGYRGKGPRNYVRSDERIQEDLCERLTEDDAVDASDISIEVQNGIVTLNGSVEQRWIKHRVEDLAEACSGVKDVVNHLRVEPAQNSIPPASNIG